MDQAKYIGYKCPNCNKRNTRTFMNIGDYLKSWPKANQRDLLCCEDCGTEFSKFTCKMCGTEALEQVTYDSSCNSYEWKSTCSVCGREEDVEISEDIWDADELENIQGELGTTQGALGFRNSLVSKPSPYTGPMGATSYLDPVDTLEDMKDISSPLHGDAVYVKETDSIWGYDSINLNDWKEILKNTTPAKQLVSPTIPIVTGLNFLPPCKDENDFKQFISGGTFDEGDAIYVDSIKTTMLYTNGSWTVLTGASTTPNGANMQQAYTQPISHAVLPGGGQVQTQKKGAINLDPIYIQDINITIHEAVFKDILDNHFGAGKCILTSNKIKGTYQEVIIVTPPPTLGGGELIANVDKKLGTITIKSKKYGRRSWLTPSHELYMALKEMAIKTSDTLIGHNENDNGMTYLENGHTFTPQLYIVKKGTVPDLNKDEDVDGGTEFKVIKPIKQFLTENPDIQKQATGMAFPDNLNYVGKTLIQLRRDDKVPFDEFKNLLAQLVIIGANDPSVKNMYEFIK